MNNTILQDLIQRHRYWHIKSGYGWPGKSIYAPAKTHYPNLVAELDYSVPWLYIMAEFADVSPEIMAAVLEDNEELSIMELCRLSQHLNVPYGYLGAPLQIVDPKTNKGKFRRRHLSDLMDRVREFTQGVLIWSKIAKTMDALNKGSVVTYAAYRFAEVYLQEEIYKQEWAQQHRPRSYRKGEPPGVGSSPLLMPKMNGKRLA